MAVDVRRYTYPRLYLPRWNVDVPAARPVDAPTLLYFPVAWFCRFLGVDKDRQVMALRRDSRYVPDLVLREVPFSVSGAWRMWLAIRKPECALWLAGIDPLRCKPEVQDRLGDFQAELMREADALLFGAAPRVPDGEARGQVDYRQSERIRIACLDCGAPHVIVIENGVARVERE